MGILMNRVVSVEARRGYPYTYAINSKYFGFLNFIAKRIVYSVIRGPGV
jgi:hypothetical protein